VLESEYELSPGILVSLKFRRLGKTVDIELLVEFISVEKVVKVIFSDFGPPVVK